MERQPGQIDQLFLDWGETGLENDLGVRVLDNEGVTTILRTTGFAEFPAGTGLYYLDPFTFPNIEGSYSLVYDDDAGTAAPGHIATEELEIAAEANPWAEIIEAGFTAEELFRLMAAVLLGKASGGGTVTRIFRDVNDSVNRVEATVEADGDRTSIVLDPT